MKQEPLNEDKEVPEEGKGEMPEEEKGRRCQKHTRKKCRREKEETSEADYRAQRSPGGKEAAEWSRRTSTYKSAVSNRWVAKCLCVVNII